MTVWQVYHIENGTTKLQICRDRCEADRLSGYWQDQGCEAWVTILTRTAEDYHWPLEM